MNDEIVETRRSVLDGQGREKTCIRRQLGDRAEELEKTFNKETGEENFERHLFNVDEKDVENFEREWHENERKLPQRSLDIGGVNSFMNSIPQIDQSSAGQRALQQNRSR